MGIKLSKEQASALDSYIESLPDEKRSSFISEFDKLPEKGQVGLTNDLLSSFKPSGAFPKQEEAKPVGDVWAQRGAKVQGNIAERGQLVPQISGNLGSPNLLRKGLGGLQALGAPFTAFEAGLSNPMLAAQQGNFNPAQLAQESLAGFKGEKLGQYGDVMRVAGYPEPLAAMGGLTLSMAGPVTSLKAIKNTFGGISKMSDSGILSAGNNLMKASDEAGLFVKANLDKAFSKVDKVKVDPDLFYESISKLPQALVSKLEQHFGRLEDVAINLNVGKLREVKQVLGKYNPGAFGKEYRGLMENLTADEINQVYSTMKKLTSSHVEKAFGVKAAKKLGELEDAATEVIRAGQYVKKTIVDSTLREATKAGKMAEKLTVEGDVSGRTALNTLRSAGPKARKAINKAVDALNHFNNVQATAKVLKHIGSAATYGGAIGAIGGTVGSKFINKAQE